MNGGSHIIDLRKGMATTVKPSVNSADIEEGAGIDTEQQQSSPEPDEEPYDLIDLVLQEPKKPRSFGWVLPTLGGIVSVAWIAGMLWLARGSIAAAEPMALAGFIAALCVPPALIGVLLLLTLRTSRAEAARFGTTARAMREEAASLERTVASLSAAIEDNRRQLADHAVALTAIGESSNARFGTLGSGMAAEIARAEENARAFSALSDNARGNLEVLLNVLPRAGEQTVSLTDALRQASVTVSESATALDAQLTALADRGREADTITGGAAQKLAAHLLRMEATSESAGARLEQVTGAMSTAVDDLLGRTANAVDEARKGIATQGEAMLAMLGTNQAALDRTAKDSVEALAGRIGAIEEMIDRVAASLSDQHHASNDLISTLGTGLSRVSVDFEQFHMREAARGHELAVSMDALRASAETMAERIKAGDVTARETIETTERLLVALDAATREIDETVPQALIRMDERIAASRQVVIDSKPELMALVSAAESTHDAIEAIATVIHGQRDQADKLAVTLLETLAASNDKALALGASVDETIAQSHRFTEEAAPRLVEALLRVRDTASAAADRARETLASVIPDAAAALQAASSDALKRATTESFERQIAAIGEAAEGAASVAERVSAKLSAQVATITQTSAIVEARIEQARNEREKAEEDNFARRVSLLIEALNSASIDIAKTFSAEVSDSSWAAYLRGDRGVFTRRAVRLLDSGEAREIARLYDDDNAFREQVNRYIHDFEAMLRAILAQRDGSPLGVTLLSSDMGKLYVALAQAIERLRT
ncbi:coiled-coil domain-containing protein [Sphingomonas immobilis]|uniref:ATPase n=1 Tax=Sphingomonas immobilis TaxID=3063997 RepID=A0ABT8ZU92_9SPHN|nr:hypothetical protein [Sphingomonas sp. CA1-15]MDO7841141.1 hypothetical protein [Sphingomonas sp. CA1-15]